MRKGSAIRITAGFLLVLAAMPLAYILFVRVQQQSIRKSMRVRLETEVLQTLTVPEKAIIWIKKGKEILVNGRMFDIKFTHLQNGVYVFKGLYDEKETVLLTQLEKNQQKSTGENKQLVQLFQFLLSCYHNQQVEFDFNENMNFETLFTNTPPLHPGFITIFSPPPQV